tara:strand:+ start:178 stop:282 length:105 start_codon:yes stop_codon:yes gene_type:complete
MAVAKNTWRKSEEKDIMYKTKKKRRRDKERRDIM